MARAHLARTTLELEVAAFVGKQGRRDSERVREAVAEIDRQVTKLVQEKDVGVVISAHYFHAWTAELIHSHLVRAACTEPPYPAADPVAFLLRNAARAGYERCIEAAHSLQWPDATALTCARSLERLDPSTYPPFSELAGRSAPIGYVPAVEGLMN